MSAKTTLREAAAALLFATGLTRPARRARDRLSIATFHRVLPDAERAAYPYPGLVVTPEELDAFLGYFVRHFDCGTLSRQHDRFLAGESPARPLLAITFDDGQYDNLRHAAPVLDRHGVKASFFIPVVAVETRELLWHDRLGFSARALLADGGKGSAALSAALAATGVNADGALPTIERLVQSAKRLPVQVRLDLVRQLADIAGPGAEPSFARLMDFGEIEALAGAGHEIGSHSMTHCLMPECDDEELRYELAESRRRLEGRLGVGIESFCYPNGNCDARTATAAATAGYRRAITTDWGGNGRDADRYRLRRFDIVARHVLAGNGSVSPTTLAFRMSGLYPGLG